MNRGIAFEIPNEYGSFLGDILKPFDTKDFNWQLGREEAYIILEGEIGNNLFAEDISTIEGTVLKNLLVNNTYYIIFADLQAYPKGHTISKMETYEEFTQSECELVLLVADSCYSTLYCKNKGKLELLFNHAHDCGFIDVQYITDENDTRTRLSV
ncbi:DUF2691 family protein [Paenibacillus eucommiae]|uniref:DUF2691 family protein n=1 Tax=Paenibacillus eucommiae TaxID=1355755 RepID=A0ABS4IS69_9BACL|nr:DUF2691 family protein [Paenibacillus eucommiae]MBP1989429.1 hypothetical protein [Paenibacillus eucommiae]